MTPKRKNLPSMQGAATYRIRVRGYLDECWAECMGGMLIVGYRGSGNSLETILQGELADQAALTGVLNTLYQLHLPVVSARFVANDSAEKKKA
jgi:hypothetical protein